MNLESLFNYNRVKENYKDTSSLETRYEVVGIVCSKKKNIDDSDYTTIIRKGMKGGFKQWLKYSRNTESYLNENSAERTLA